MEELSATVRKGVDGIGKAYMGVLGVIAAGKGIASAFSAFTAPAAELENVASSLGVVMGNAEAAAGARTGAEVAKGDAEDAANAVRVSVSAAAASEAAAAKSADLLGDAALCSGGNVFSGATLRLAFSRDNGNHGGMWGNDKAHGVFFPAWERVAPYCPAGRCGESD